MEDNHKNNNLNKIAYYPGCSLSSTAIDFNVSLKGLLDALNIEHIDIDDWNCCGTTPAYNTSEELAAILSARNLLLAKKMGLEDILSPCVSCYNKLYKAAYYINSANELKNKREERIRDSVLKALNSMGFDTGQELNFKVYSIIEFLYLKKTEIGRRFKELKTGNNKSREYSILKGLTPACYYGCALLRPKDALKFDDIERPTSMEEILKEVDIDCRDFSFKTECCGAILSLSNKDSVLKLSGEILDAALESDVDSLIVFCPLCQQNLDLRQKQINRFNKTGYNLPILYITQILGMALGLTCKQVMLDRLFVPIKDFRRDKIKSNNNYKGKSN
ncbi:MAG: CoB--CoM heterodisulfide reductase iron-sulfur subunit B family protein [Actinobacteria bacterium]|nr:CoB--CoM heterodisulfide reductase iron-sulfur subunit B family protein [Actinomycetota bacterium]